MLFYVIYWSMLKNISLGNYSSVTFLHYFVFFMFITTFLLWFFDSQTFQP
jgi:hypothetical protein